MNDKKLVSQDELTELMYKYIKPELDKHIVETGGRWTYCCDKDSFFWNLYSIEWQCYRTIGCMLINDHWEIFNKCNNDAYVNIKIFNCKVLNDQVIFFEDSYFNDFDKDFMRGLYEKIKEYIKCNNIKEEMNDKKLVNQKTLLYIISGYLKPEIDKCIKNNECHFKDSSDGKFCWHLGNNVRTIAARLVDDHWEISNCGYNEENINIKIYSGYVVEFIEDSVFHDFSKGFMYGLYYEIKNAFRWL